MKREIASLQSRSFKLIVLFLLTVTLEITLVTAQNLELTFEKLTIRDGLSHSNVYSIIQDESGYLWFGTQDGLNRYDGKEITIFRNKSTDSTTISTGNFGKIFQDRSGVYWFGTFGGGIDKYDPKKNSIKNYSNIPDDPNSLSNNQVLFIFQDSDGTIWVGTPDGGLNRYNSNDNTFTRFQHNPEDSLSLSNNRAKSMCETADGILWVGTGNGLNKFNKSEGTFTRYYHNPLDNNSLSGNIIQNMIADPDGTLWIVLRDGGLNKFDPKTNKVKRFTHNPLNPKSISDNQADCIVRDSYNNIWIGTYDGGLNLFDPLTEEFSHFKHNPNNFRSISSNRIEYLFEDRSQILWIGTRGGGINKVDLKPRKFFNLVHDANSSNRLPQHAIMSIASDSEGNVWFGSDGGGLTKYNPNNNTFQNFVNQPNNTNSLSNNRVWSLLFDSKNNLWVGTYQGGLNKLENVNGNLRIKRYLHIPKTEGTISNNQINSIMQDKDGNIWVATANGLNKFIEDDDSKQYHIKNYYHNKSDSAAFVDNYVNSIIQDSEGRIWIGSYQSGLIEFDSENEVFINHIANDTKSSNYYKKLKLLTIFEDSHQNIWLGTESSGLLCFDPQQNTFTPHPNNNVLGGSMVLNIIEDDFENLWISSTRGLSRYSLSDNSFNSYTILDGLEGEGFNRNAAHKTSEGKLYFGSNTGVTYLLPKEVKNNPHIPKVTLTDFKVLNKSIWENFFAPNVTILNSGGEIVLDHKDYFFSIHFASLDFTNPAKNQYKYKLEGFNDNWIEISNNSSATFTNLNPGTYVFKVMGSNNDKIWNEVPTELKITIIPPIWKRTWFYILEILLFLLVVLAYIRFRTFRLIRDKKVLEEKVTERTNEIKAQKEELEATLDKLKNTQTQLIQSEKMASLGVLTSGIAHEINNPLNYIQGGVNALEDYIEENIKEHTEGIAPILGMIDEGVNRASQIVRSLNRFSVGADANFESCELHKIIDNCLLVIQNQLKNRIDIRKNYSENEPKVHGSEAKLHQVFISILINAAQAVSEKGEIDITTQIKNKVVKITIADNGCGISEEHLPKIADPFFTTKDPGKGTGLGLSIVYSIIREHNGAINFESELGKGTKVTVALPVYEK